MKSMDRQIDIQKKMIQMKSELDYLSGFEDLILTILYRIDGIPILTQYGGQISSEILSLSSWIKDIITKISHELREGIDNVTYHKNDYPIIFNAAGRSAILVAVLDPLANLGMLSMETARISYKLKDIIN